jgi:hypothetical protein
MFRVKISTVKGWRDMQEFVGVDLEDSFVLGWQHDHAGRRVIFELEASLWPPHPLYETPAQDRHTCYRRGRLVFDDVLRLAGLRTVVEAKSTTDPDGTVDYGNIEGLCYEDGVYRFSGDIGEVECECRDVRVEFGEVVDSV